MRGRRVMVGVLLAGLLVPACRAASGSGSTSEEPASVEPIEGSDISRVILTERAAERIELQTAPVQAAERLVVIPYSAVFYGLSGETWTYTNPESLTFVRESIAVDHVEDGLAYLSSGPSAGAAVVTVGAAELFGVETGVGH